MKRLLLIPALAIALIACREKHTTTTATPPAPDPNAYSNGHVHGQDTVVHSSSGSGSSGSSGSTTNNNSVVTVKSDTVITIVTMPNNGTGTPTATATASGTAPADSSQLSRLVVSFYSIGAGINYDVKAEFDRWLAKDTQGGFTYTVTQWGREGEVNYCFNLASKSASDQKVFVKDVQKFLDGKEHVHVNEWAVCDRRAAQTGSAGQLQPGNNTPANIAVAQRDTATERLVVSFISKGEGIDQTAKQQLDKYLTKHPEVKCKIVHWGREGEMDYVFLIRSRTLAEQQNTVTDVRNTIGANERVLIQENIVPHRANPAEEPPIAAEPVDSNIVRLVVSFASKGEGIDETTRLEFEQWLYQRGNVTWEITSWGREGEKNYCFRLANMDSRQQEIFVRDVRTFLTDKPLVFVNEWAPCDKRR